MVSRNTILAAKLLAATAALSSANAWANSVVVRVSGINNAQGQIGCALFENGSTFPMDNRNAKQIWVDALPAGVVCIFPNVAAGSYAVSIAHDTNGNQKVDTNFLGVPKEGWGVSNNVVPTMRAPTFEEARFLVKEGAPVDIEVKLVY